VEKKVEVIITIIDGTVEDVSVYRTEFSAADHVCDALASKYPHVTELVKAPPNTPDHTIEHAHRLYDAGIDNPNPAGTIRWFTVPLSE
jgi:hypothetical protein